MNKKNFEKEKQNLILENNQIKKQLADALNLLKREEEKNAQRDNEVYNFKNDELPKLQKSYENLIQSMREEKEKCLMDMNNKIEELTKQNLALQYKLEKNNQEKILKCNKIIEDLNITINSLKNEINSKNTIIDKLNNENDELNSHTEEIKSKYNKEIQELKNENSILNQNLSQNISELKILKDELIKLKRCKTNDEQICLRLKTEKETKDNEINNLKRLLIEKEDEGEALSKELEKLKEGYNNLNMNFSEAAGQLEALSSLEKKYNALNQEFNRLKKENSEHKNGALHNAKIINVMKQKMAQKDDNIKSLINEKEHLKQDILDLQVVENKFNELCEENEELKNTSEKYDNLKREYDLLQTK
jgi:chromosome segregation ATPase